MNVCMKRIFPTIDVVLFSIAFSVIFSGCYTGLDNNARSTGARRNPAEASIIKQVSIPLPDPVAVSNHPGGSASGDVRLRPGLVINVVVLVAGKKEIEISASRVTDSGSIAVPLLGTVEVKDLTLDEVVAKLMTGYREFFVNPQVLAEFVLDTYKEGQSPWGSVTVLGRVRKPGKVGIPATRDMTLSAAIQQAGGFDTSAKQAAIRITRRLTNGIVESREVNFRSVGSEGRVEDDIKLEADDVVFVPELVF